MPYSVASYAHSLPDHNDQDMNLWAFGAAETAISMIVLTDINQSKICVDDNLTIEDLTPLAKQTAIDVMNIYKQYGFCRTLT